MPHVVFYELLTMMCFILLEDLQFELLFLIYFIIRAHLGAFKVALNRQVWRLAQLT